MTGLFDGTFARGGAAAAVSDEAWFRALLEAEAALARAAAGLGLVPTTAADAVTAAGCRPGAPGPRHGHREGGRRRQSRAAAGAGAAGRGR